MAYEALDFILERADKIRAGAEENEKLMKLNDDAAGVLRESGIMRLMAPKTHGGAEAHPREFAETVMATAAIDGSTGWHGGIVGVHPWELAMADPKVQDEVLGEDPDTWTASPYAPMGVAVPTDGGYILNGKWSFSSGTDHCSWLFIGAMIGDAEGKPLMPPQTMHVLVPREDYTIDADSWNVVGLRGTGSKDVIVKNAFVPTHRTMDAAKIMSGQQANDMGLTQTLYNLPYWHVFPLGITAAVLGIAEGALAAHIEMQKQRTLVTGQPLKENPYMLNAIGEAAAESQASRAALLDTAARFFDRVDSGGTVTLQERADGRRTQVRAAHRAVRAVDQIFDIAGGRALHVDTPLQRFWRDSHAGLVHAVHDTGQPYH